MGEAINGVFKGGGAKGIAYAGALQACEDAGVEFRATAGSSAGAITAALVACGYSAGEIEGLMPDGLACLDRPSIALLKWWRPGLMSPERLRRWLCARIAERVQPQTASSGLANPSFEDVRNTTGISLYVVAMDLASGQPVVFSPDLTPLMPVADAVIASSAIPVAFPPQRVVVNGEVRRLVDGGAWANYPDFVFQDKSFRDRCDLRDGAEERRTLGFILDDEAVKPGGQFSDVRPVRGPRMASDLGSAARKFGMLGALGTSSVVRLVALLAPAASIFLVLAWLRDEVERGLPAVARLPAGLRDLMLMSATGLLVIGVATAALTALVVARFGREVADTGMVGAAAALGVGPSVPYWVGTRDEREDESGVVYAAVRIPVPIRLKTLRFRPSRQVVAGAVTRGYESTAQVLTDSFGLEIDRRGTPGVPISNDADAPNGLARLVLGLLNRALRLPIRLVRWMPTNTIAWAFILYMALLYSWIYISRVLDGFAGGEVALRAMALVGISAVVLVWVVGMRGAHLARRTTSWLQHLPTLPLVFFGGLAVLSLVLFVGTMWSNGDAVTLVLQGEGRTENIERAAGESGILLFLATLGISAASSFWRIVQQRRQRADAVAISWPPPAEPGRAG